jgi:chromosome partitioning protein
MIITLYSTKSSTKTSIAVSTAIYLANKSNKIIFADLDTSQASASQWLDCRQDNEKLIRIPSIQKSGKYIARELLELQNNYTYVIADCAGHADINGRSALTVSDIAIIPVLPSSLSLFTIESTLNSCIDAQTLNPKLKIIIVLTNCHSNRLVKDTQEARDTILESIEGVSNFKLADTQITSRKVWIDIVAEGKGITESNNLQAIEEFKKLMSEVF